MAVRGLKDVVDGGVRLDGLRREDDNLVAVAGKEKCQDLNPGLPEVSEQSAIRVQ